MVELKEAEVGGVILPSSTLAAVLALAVAYSLTGALGLLAVPAGYRPTAWPQAGIALAGLLLLGYRAWPGVWLGGFLVHAAFGPGGATAAAPRSLVLAAGLGLGAALQALAGPGWSGGCSARSPLSAVSKK